MSIRKRSYSRIINSSPMFFGSKDTNEKGIINELKDILKDKNRKITISRVDFLPIYEYEMKIECYGNEDYNYVEKVVKAIYKKYQK
jgi:hypothetical protein